MTGAAFDEKKKKKVLGLSKTASILSFFSPMISFHNLHIWEAFHRSAWSPNSHWDLEQPRAYNGNLWLAREERLTNYRFDSTSVNREIGQKRNQEILGLSYLKFQRETITSMLHTSKLRWHNCCQCDLKTNCKEHSCFLTQTGYRRSERRQDSSSGLSIYQRGDWPQMSWANPVQII